MLKDEPAFNRAMNIGVQGYLLKESAVTEIVSCLISVAAGTPYVSPVLSGFLLNRRDRRTSLAAHLPGQEHGTAAAEADLDSAHAALTATVTAAATETNVFSQSANACNDEADQVDAVHDAYRRLTALLSDPARRLHGWSDEQASSDIDRLREAVMEARSPTRDEAVAVPDMDETPSTSSAAASLGLVDSIHRVETVHAALVGLAALRAPGG
jgi:hypothetical protein